MVILPNLAVVVSKMACVMAGLTLELFWNICYTEYLYRYLPICKYRSLIITLRYL